MGFIYKINFSNGKSYIGKTSKTVEFRYKQHQDSSMRCDGKSPALEAAMRIHDVKNVETLVQCSDEQLNDYETKFIELFSTIAPGGYNLTVGGDGNSTPHTEEYKENKSKQMRIHGCDDNLPMYIRLIPGRGYKVIMPGKQFAQFCDPDVSMKEKKDAAMNHLNLIQEDIADESNRQKHYDFTKDLPKYISYLKRCDGFRVKKPGYPNKYYKSSKLSRAAKMQLAIDYLNTLN